MKNLIAAFTIFNKYIPDKEFPIGAEHDVLYVCLSPEVVSEEDKNALYDLGFYVDNSECSFVYDT